MRFSVLRFAQFKISLSIRLHERKVEEKESSQMCSLWNLSMALFSVLYEEFLWLFMEIELFSHIISLL